MDRALDRGKRFQLLRSLVDVETIPEIATNSDDARKSARKIAERDGLDEIVKPVEHGEHACERRLLARDGDHKKDGGSRQGRIDALRVDRHPVPVLSDIPNAPAFLRL